MVCKEIHKLMSLWQTDSFQGAVHSLENLNKAQKTRQTAVPVFRLRLLSQDGKLITNRMNKNRTKEGGGGADWGSSNTAIGRDKEREKRGREVETEGF